MTRFTSLRDPRRFGLVAVLCLCIALLTLQLAVHLAGAALAGAFVGQIVKARGEARISRDGSELSAGSGTALQLGDVIKTGAGARLRLRFVDGTILALGENTQMSIDIFSVDAANKSRTVVLTMLEGVVNAAAAKSGEKQFDFQIKTANGYSAVRGTKWIVAAPGQARPGPVEGADKMVLCVLNGQVEFGPNAPEPGAQGANGAAKPVLVNGGSWGSIDPQGAVSPIKPTTPQLLQPLLDATSDTPSSSAPLPGTTPPTVVPPVPATPLFPPKPPNNRAYRNDNKGEKMDKDSDHGKTGN